MNTDKLDWSNPQSAIHGEGFTFKRPCMHPGCSGDVFIHSTEDSSKAPLYCNEHLKEHGNQSKNRNTLSLKKDRNGHNPKDDFHVVKPFKHAEKIAKFITHEDAKVVLDKPFDKDQEERSLRHHARGQGRGFLGMRHKSRKRLEEEY